MWQTVWGPSPGSARKSAFEAYRGVIELTAVKWAVSGFSIAFTSFREQIDATGDPIAKIGRKYSSKRLGVYQRRLDLVPKSPRGVRRRVLEVAAAAGLGDGAARSHADHPILLLARARPRPILPRP